MTSDPAQMPYDPCAVRVCGVLRRPRQHPETTLNNPDLPPKAGPVRVGPGRVARVGPLRRALSSVPPRGLMPVAALPRVSDRIGRSKVLPAGDGGDRARLSHAGAPADTNVHDDGGIAPGHRKRGPL